MKTVTIDSFEHLFGADFDVGLSQHGSIHGFSVISQVLSEAPDLDFVYEDADRYQSEVAGLFLYKVFANNSSCQLNIQRVESTSCFSAVLSGHGFWPVDCQTGSFHRHVDLQDKRAFPRFQESGPTQLTVDQPASHTFFHLLLSFQNCTVTPKNQSSCRTRNASRNHLKDTVRRANPTRSHF